jgi:hypothetical protein
MIKGSCHGPHPIVVWPADALIELRHLTNPLRHFSGGVARLAEPFRYNIHSFI